MKAHRDDADDNCSTDAKATPTKRVYTNLGPWRAYVSEHGSGSKIDAHDLAIRYAQLTDEEKAVYQRRADAVADTRKLGVAVPEPFKPRQKTIAKELNKQKQAALERRSQDVGVAIDTTEHMESLAADAAPDESLTLQKCVTRIKQQARALRKTINDKRLAQERTVNTFKESGIAVAQLTALRRMVPEFNDPTFQIEPVPQGGAACFKIAGDARRVGTELAAWSTTQAGVFNSAGAVIDSHFASCFQTIIHDTCPVIDHAADREELTAQRCLKCGFCICSARGKATKRLRDACYAVVKTVCKSGTTQQTRLRNGDFVLCVFPGTGPDADEGKRVYAHIAHTSFSPYEMMFHVLRPTGLKEDGVIQMEATVVLIHMSRCRMAQTVILRSSTHVACHSKHTRRRAKTFGRCLSPCAGTRR